MNDELRMRLQRKHISTVLNVSNGLMLVIFGFFNYKTLKAPLANGFRA